MKIDNSSVNALLTDKLLPNIPSKILSNTFIKHVPLMSTAFTWYANYNDIAYNKGGVGTLIALQTILNILPLKISKHISK